MLSIRSIGGFQFFVYAFPITLIFYSILSLFESESFLSLNNLLFILLSSIANYILVIIFQYIFLNNISNEWR